MNAFITSKEIVFAFHLCEHDITWQTNAFNASTEIVSATHLRIQDHTADELDPY